MRTFLIVATIALLASPTLAADEDIPVSLRLLMHATVKNIGGSMFGTTIWIAAPNITDDPSTWVVLAGPRIDGEGWHVDLLSGAMATNMLAVPLLDLRFELNPVFWGIPLYVWGNLEWIFNKKKGFAYTFLQVDYVLPLEMGLVGVETENILRFENGKDDIRSVGPHLALPMGKMTLVVAYQFHWKGLNQVWFRVITNY